MQLQDKVALVTGGSSGIGQAIAIRFAKEGAKVAINVRPGGKSGQDTLTEALRHTQHAMLAPASVDDRAQIETMFDEVIRAFGRIDIVVNNAGIEIQKPFLEATDEEWHKVISVDLYGPYAVSQVAARQMVKQGGGGKLIFISSVHEDIPFVGYTSYCAAKGGIRMMMRNLAMELAQHRINVNNIAPGAIATPINQKVLDNPQEKENVVTEIPWGRWGQPEDVAAVAVFLASRESDYVTGSTYYVDGGLTQQVTKY
jgi:glucose 1-dehydrogenase